MQREQHVEPDPDVCPACGIEMYELERQREAVVCADCDLALERQLAALLRYADEARAIRDGQAS